jgi:hypothetical protein
MMGNCFMTPEHKRGGAKKKVFLHIGHVKTGTSAIQHFFIQNREWFKRHGVLYPETGLYGPGHHKIPVGLVSREALSDFLIDSEKKKYSECFFEENLYERLVSELHISDCHSVLISSEYFVFLRNLKELKKMLNDFDVKIVINLRRQDCLLESFYRQILLAGWAKGVEPFLEKYKLFLGDYRKILNVWMDAFGFNSLIVNDYGLWTGMNDIYESFTRLMGVPFDASLLIPTLGEGGMMNISMDTGFSALIRLYNQFGLPGRFRSKLIDRLRFLQNDVGKDYVGSGTFLSPAMSRSLLEEFRKDDEWIEKCFWDNGSSTLTDKSGITTMAFSGFNFWRVLKIISRLSETPKYNNK